MIIEPSGTFELIIELLYKEIKYEILAVQDRFPKQVQQRCTTPRPMSYPSLSAILLIWKYKQPPITNAPSSPREEGEPFSTYPSWSARRERRRLIATKKKKREGEEERYWHKLFKLQFTVVPKNKSDYYFLPWNSSFESFFSANSFLLDTNVFFYPMPQIGPPFHSKRVRNIRWSFNR